MATQRRNFTPQEIESTWSLAIPVEGFSPDQIRRDYAGAYIMKDHYGDRTSKFGWEIDHIVPLSKNGLYEINNYAPLQWENNVIKDENFPFWQTKVKFEENTNIEFFQDWFGAVSDKIVRIIPVKKD